jgi:serine/threonine protein kinase
MSEPEPEPLGRHDPRQVGRYRLVSFIGEGGMGRVYLGTSAGRIYAAVKVMHSHLARDASFRERFRREVHLAKRVSGRFTARILDSGVDAEIPWLATEYISGPTLEQAVARRGEYSEEAVLLLAKQLAQALRDIHSSKVIHRDLKPSNIICSVDGVRVIDFGIARALDGRMASSQLIGTPGYMSPEHLGNRTVTEASDIFSLGGVLVYASTRRHPERSAGADQSEGIDLRYVPYRLRDLIEGCVQVNPYRRPTADHLLKQVDELRLPGNAGRAPSPNGTRRLPNPGGYPPEPTQSPPVRNRDRSAGIRQWSARMRRGYQRKSDELRKSSRNWPFLGVKGSRRWARWSVVLGSLSVTEVVSRTAQAQHVAHGPLPRLKTVTGIQAAVKQFTGWIPDPVSHWIFSAATAAQTDQRLAAITTALLVLTLIARRAGRNHIHQLMIKTVATGAGTLIKLAMVARLLRTGFGPVLHVAEVLRWWALIPLLVSAVLIALLSRAPGDRPASI